jgi:hypothetical protein
MSSHPATARDERITAVILELAELGRRIGRRAADLARLAEATRPASTEGDGSAAADLAAAAADLAAGADAMATKSRPRGKGSSRERRAAPVTSPIDRRRSRASGGLPQPAPAIRHRSRTAVARSGTASLAKWSAVVRGPVLMSGLVHAVAIVALSLFFLPAPKHRTPLALDFGTTEAAGSAEFAAVDLAPADPVAEAEAAEMNSFLAEPLPMIDERLVVESPALEASELEPTSLLEPVAADAAALAAAAAPDLLAADAIGGGGLAAEPAGGGGGGPGHTPAAAAAGRQAATFFGRNGTGNTVCFLCDNSSSYRDGGFHMVLDELARAVDGLRPDQSFFVVFFSDAAYPLFHPAPAEGLAPATPDNKRRLRAWLQTAEMCRGGQGIHDAVKLAGSLEPHVVYLLSDGQMTGSVVDRVRDADFGAATVHTFGIQQSAIDRRSGQVDADRLREQEGYNRNLLTIATAHGGGFTPVMVPPAAAALERLRPIARNRTRGPVWGLRL